MSTAHVTGGVELRALALRLKAAGDEGKGIRRKLSRQLQDSVKPLAKKISDSAYLRPYMPDRYADVLAADLGARVASSLLGTSTPRIEVRAKARAHARKIALLDRGLINHPVYARGPRRGWSWSNSQTGGMRAGFFTDAIRDETPYIRDQVVKVLTETAREVTGHG